MNYESPLEILEGGPRHCDLGARAAVDRASLGLAVTAKQRFKPQHDDPRYIGSL